jgi:anti-anti-sigma factor
VATPVGHSLDRRSITDGGLVIAIGPARETCLVTLVGELDLSNAPTLREELHGLLSMELKTVVLDLESLEFIDSSGIRCLLETTLESRGNGDRFRILDSLHPHVDRALRVSEAREVLPFMA